MTKKQYDILNNGNKKVAILVDPDKTNSPDQLEPLIKKVEILRPAFIFVGGSTVDQKDFSRCLSYIKEHTTVPVILFPGSHHQVSNKADGILFLSLISGRNPDYLIGHQIESAHILKDMDVEVIPTGYLLIDGGKPSAVSYVSQTRPIPTDQTTIAVKTSIAGEMLGFKAIFLDAGSGANTPVKPEMIAAIKTNTSLPIIVGGVIKTTEQMELAMGAGADLIVIGNRIEENIDFLLDIQSLMKNEKV